MSLLNISAVHIKGSPKRIGRLDGNPVFLLVTKGGLNVVLARYATGAKALASAPHPGIAKAMASRGYPDLIIDELSKSEGVNLDFYKHLLPVFEDTTKRLNEGLEG